ncbi:primosomal protein [Gephyromycinifex aptenodytis]|uniref:primosomal protein n=1 Tax=Gephyromycinifex aptenodytis TaxID=2716227 RepID=UPI00144528DF|nr:primosomal protein [Gephyromycinifex aptenodytis]
MSADPRAALATFVTALERHLEAASSRHGENDPAVVAAYQDVAEAFDRYEDALMDAFEEVTPLEIFSDDDFDDDIDGFDDDDDSDDDDSDDDDDDDSDDESDDDDDDDSDDDSDD